MHGRGADQEHGALMKSLMLPALSLAEGIPATRLHQREN